MSKITKPKAAARIRPGWSWNSAVGFFFKAPLPKWGPTPAIPRAVMKTATLAFA